MPWARLDDKFWGHPKIVALPHSAIGLYALGLSYAAGQLTDGVLPKRLVSGWRDGPAVRALLEAGLWQTDPEGFVIHDYLDWNPSRESVLAERAAANKRMRSKTGRSSREIQPDSGRNSGELRQSHTTLGTTGIDAAAAGETPASRARGDGGFQPLGSFLRRPSASTTAAAAADENLPDDVRERLQRPPIIGHAVG